MKRLKHRRQRVTITVELWPEHAAVLNANMRREQYNGGVESYLGLYLRRSLMREIEGDAIFNGRPKLPPHLDNHEFLSLPRWLTRYRMKNRNYPGDCFWWRYYRWPVPLDNVTKFMR